MKIQSWRRGFAVLACLMLVVAQVWADPALPVDKVAQPQALSSPSPMTAPVESTARPRPEASAASIEPDATVSAEKQAGLGLDEGSQATSWAEDGSVGRSTFMDRARKVTWVLALMFFLIWALSKVTGKPMLEKLDLLGEPSSFVEILEKKRVGPGRSIILMKVGLKALVVASTEGGMRTLTEVSEEDYKRYRQDKELKDTSEVEASATKVATGGPMQVVRHYLSIIPGLGVKR